MHGARGRQGLRRVAARRPACPGRRAGTCLNVTVRKALLAALAVLLLAPAVALAAFPGSDPDESVRINTPDDPDFDHCEPDDEQGADLLERVRRGVRALRLRARPPRRPRRCTATPARPRASRSRTPRPGATRSGQIPGVSADRAWKRSTGRPDVRIAILDTGIRWRERSLRTKVALNAGELPLPAGLRRARLRRRRRLHRRRLRRRPARDARRPATTRPTTLLDASDLLAAFSDGTDADANGYVDDIAGWDFFDDDNDPYDASSYSSAADHGTGRAQEAGPADRRRRRRHRRLPALHDRAAAGLGHLRHRHQPVRARRRATPPTTASRWSRRRSAG